MPKKPMDYSRTIIYKIVCKDLLVIDKYIGHTTEFTQRKYLHKICCNNENDKAYNFKIYKIIRANGNWDNWEMIEVEKYPCNDNNEATARERYWYETFNATLNTQVPNRSRKEYLKEYYKKYRETNKEKSKEQFTCDCGSTLRFNDKARHLKTKKHIDFNNSL